MHCRNHRVAFAILLIAVWARPAYAIDWHTDLDDAKRTASQQKRDLFILFTGTEWCGHCVAFEHEVLSRVEFQKVADDFVLVKIEFPASHDELPPERRERYTQWRDQFGADAVPIVFLADPTGKPYAVTGQLGIDAVAYVRHVGKLAETRARRDEALREAAAADGLERARHLDAALSAVANASNRKPGQADGDVLLRFYRAEVDEILKLSDDGSELHAKYRRILDAGAEQKLLAAIYAELDSIRKSKGLDAAIAFVTEQIEAAETANIRSRLRQTRLVLLEWADRHEEALQYARELAEDESLSPFERRRVRSRIAFNLFRLKRVDDAVRVYDDLIAELPNDPREASRHLYSKASQLSAANRLDEAIDAYRAAGRLAAPGTRDRLDADVLCARLMTRAGRSAEAIEILDDLLESDTLAPLDRASVLADRAAALRKSGRGPEADESVAQAEKLLNELPDDAAPGSTVEFIRSRLKVARRE